MKHLTARQRLQLTYRTKQMEISARAELLYNNSHNNVKETRTETYDYRFGTEVQYYFPWGIELFIYSAIPVLVSVLQIWICTESPTTILERSIERKRAHSTPVTVQIKRSGSSHTGFAIIGHLVGYTINGILRQDGSNHIPLVFGIIGVEI